MDKVGLTIPFHTLRRMVRAYLVPTIALYAVFGINFLALPLSVKNYGGIFANQWLWGILFLGSALWLSYGLADRTMGRMLGMALFATTIVTGMWIFAVTATTIIGQINYVSPFVWIYTLFNNLLVILAHTFINPKGAIFPERFLRPFLSRVAQRIGPDEET